MKTSLILTVIFFCVFHTQDYWSEYTSLFFFILFIAIFGAFLFVLGTFFSELYHCIRENFKSTQRNVSLLITALVIALTIYAPSGLVKYDWFTADDIIVAEREGAANCMTSLQLKKDGTFLEVSVCFGSMRKDGVFKIKNDTIWFASNYDFYEFGTIGTNHLGNSHIYLNLHESKQDTLPYFMMLPK